MPRAKKSADTPPTPAPEFPLRLACIDMGSNAIRFMAAEFTSPTEMNLLATERRPVRLGHGVFLTGKLVPAAMDAAVAAMHDFGELMESLQVQAYNAVATSAVRESKNGREFVERILDQTGLELDVITGSEEARYVHLAVARRIPLGSQQWVLVDLGGGSVEVSLVDASGIHWSESHTMGSVRLLEELASSADEPGRFKRLLAEYVDTLNIPSAASDQKPAGFIATGGNIETLAKLGGESRADGVGVLTLEKLRATIDTLARLSFRQRVDELRLREDRADVILPAAMVYERLARLTGCESILVPFVGIKDGLLHDLVERISQTEDQRDRQEREVAAAAVTLGRRYMFDEAHGTQVAMLALSLFDQLHSLHGLGHNDRKLLHAAALLHDIGQHVSYKGHHKHSMYLLTHSELPNYSPREMAMVANVARYHRKSEPQDHHHYYITLPEAARPRVVKLAAILRLADALDREHSQRVRAVTADSSGKDVVLSLSGSGEMLLEGWSFKKKSQMFSNMFKRKVQIRIVPH